MGGDKEGYLVVIIILIIIPIIIFLSFYVLNKYASTEFFGKYIRPPLKWFYDMYWWFILCIGDFFRLFNYSKNNRAVYGFIFTVIIILYFVISLIDFLKSR
jgi:hypothetical protein